MTLYSSFMLFVQVFVAGGLVVFGWWLRGHQSLRHPGIRQAKTSDLARKVSLLESVINASPDMLFVKDKGLRTVLANKSFADAVGKVPEEMYGKTDLENGWRRELIYGDSENKVSGFIHYDHKALGGSYVHLSPDPGYINDELKYYDTQKIPLYGENNEVMGVLGISRDITQRVRAEEARNYYIEFQSLVTELATKFINLSTEHYDRAIDEILSQVSAFIGADRSYIYHFTEDLGHVSMAYEWCKSPGESEIDREQSVSSKSFNVVFEKLKEGQIVFIPDVNALPEDRQEEKDRLLERGIQSKITLPLFRDTELIGSLGFHSKQTYVKWVEGTVSLLRIIAEIYMNLMKRKQIEQEVQYRISLLENVDDAIIATDMENVIRSWNNGAKALYGYTAEEAIGKRLNDVVSPLHQIGSEDSIYKLDSYTRQKGEFIHHSKDGEQIDILESASYICDLNGTKTGIVYIIHDIREKKLLDFKKLEIALHQERIQVLEGVVSDLTHDLKTPLTSMGINLYMLKKNPAQQEKYIDNLLLHTNKLNKIVDDILAMSRFDKGGLLKTSQFDLNILIDSICTSRSSLIEEKRLTLSKDLHTDLKLLTGDQTALERAITNLLDNAIAYTPPEKKISIKTYLHDAKAIVEVTDTGIGISDDDLPMIFDRFFRADKARNTNAGGTGLGLAIVKRIIELHDGTIDVDSNLDAGTTFRIHLPTEL